MKILKIIYNWYLNDVFVFEMLPRIIIAMIVTWFVGFYSTSKDKLPIFLLFIIMTLWSSRPALKRINEI